jgi:hypothetical protein
LVIPYFFEKRSAGSLPRWRIWANYYTDIGLMVYLNAIYLLQPILSPIVICATGIVWTVIYRKAISRVDAFNQGLAATRKRPLLPARDGLLKGQSNHR